MNHTSFWQSRRALVLGCSGFLGTALTQTLLQLGASVSGFVRTTRETEFFRSKLHLQIDMIRGPATPEKLRNVIAIHQPDCVFQLAAEHRKPTKQALTNELLTAVAKIAPQTAIIVPLNGSDTKPRFENDPIRSLRVGFVTLPSVFGRGMTRQDKWVAKLFDAAAERKLLPLPIDPNEPFLPVGEAVHSLLGTAELLVQMPEIFADGLWLDTAPLATARELYERVNTPVSVQGNRLGEAVVDTLNWSLQKQLTAVASSRIQKAA